MSADVLTIGGMRNVKPELAEAKGKRLIISAESEEGVRMPTSVMKQLASTDQIYAEKKYKAPLCLHTVAHPHPIHEPPAQGGCNGCGHLAQAHRHPV